MQSVLSPIVGRLSDVLDRKYTAAIPPLIAFIGACVCAKATSMTMLIGGEYSIDCERSECLEHQLTTVAIRRRNSNRCHTGYNLRRPIDPFRGAAAQIPCVGERLLLSWWCCWWTRRQLGSRSTHEQELLGLARDVSTAIRATNRARSDILTKYRQRFWMQAAFHLFTSLGFLLFYWPTKHADRPRLSFKQILWAIDPIGSVLFITAATLLLLAFDWAGGAYTWSNPHVAAPLGIGVGLFVLFGLYEWKGRDDGIVAHVFFKGSPNFALSCFAFAVEGWIFYSAVNSVTTQITLHLGFSSSSWTISLRQLSFNCVTIIASVPITLYATKYKDLKWPLIGKSSPNYTALNYKKRILTSSISNLHLLPHHNHLLRLHHTRMEQGPDRPERHLRHRSIRPSDTSRRPHPVHRAPRLPQYCYRSRLQCESNRWCFWLCRA